MQNHQTRNINTIPSTVHTTPIIMARRLLRGELDPEAFEPPLVGADPLVEADMVEIVAEVVVTLI
jgi:hypothetical protein